eukprot:Blabericola_migrator_1__628@NODE_1156_length_5256_cov_104_579881_g787_i0_p1_GENE_NODE_1156_length_5256_cov_104_579881_g787_i0NODE_1156_length_5256_cov_104_579881_g787_i0_p1_ORF_typecomplete_len411_score65_71PAS_4/PF08448_10/0_041PAS_4/PF08448_10/1_4e04PAS_4/PF08448_10/8_7e03_NODE_1156_length_5256_cov_104_579881_g787_i018923124
MAVRRYITVTTLLLWAKHKILICLRDKHRALSAALLVALAVNPTAQDVSALHNVVDLGDSRHDAHAEAPKHKWSSNSVDLLHAREEGQGEPTYVPSFLRPVNPAIIVDRDALERVINAVSEGQKDSDIQNLINRCFPANDFGEHLFSHLRVFLAGKPFLHVSPPRDRRWLMRKLRRAPSESVEILDAESTVALKHIENAQRWFAVHFRTVAQMMNTSLLFDFHLLRLRRDGTPIPKPGTKLKDSAYHALTVGEIKELYDMSDHFSKVGHELMVQAEALEAKLDSKSKKKWLNYAKRLKFRWWDDLVPPLQVERRLHLITWMLRYGPPKFFAKHRNEFANLADLLTQYNGATNGPSTQLLKNLRFLGRAMRDLCLTTEDLKPLEEHCKRLVAHRYWMAPNRPFLSSNSANS